MKYSHSFIFFVPELERLLGTAKDEERREFIRNAIAALDNSSHAGSSGHGSTVPHIAALHPLAQSHLFNQSVSNFYRHHIWK